MQMVSGQVVQGQVVPVPAAAGTGGLPSVADELLKLQSLRDSGALTQAEFEAQKQKLLAA